MGSTGGPSEKASSSDSKARAFGAGDARVAKVSGAEMAAEVVDGIVDDPFQEEITRPGGAMDWLVGHGHAAWQEVVSASHDLGGGADEADVEGASLHADHGSHGDASADLHSTIHDHPDHHGHDGDLTHDPVVHPPDHSHSGPPHDG